MSTDNEDELTLEEQIEALEKYGNPETDTEIHEWLDLLDPSKEEEKEEQNLLLIQKNLENLYQNK